MQRMTCKMQQHTSPYELIMNHSMNAMEQQKCEKLPTFMNAMEQQKCQKLPIGKVILIQKREYLAVGSIQKLDYNK